MDAIYKEIFVSYSWDTPEHEERVLDFTNHLRAKGFTAVNDKILNQRETAINFVKMMYQAMNDYNKVIVILSKGYKEKADGFKGGVGQEYELMINDLNKNSNKYIFASFEGRKSDIVPEGLKGRDIIDLLDPNEEERLFAKLMNHQSYAVAEVANEKPKLQVREIKEFACVVPSDLIIINEPKINATGDSSSIGGKYKTIEFSLKLSFTNNTSEVVNGFAYNLILIRELDINHYFDASSDGFVTHQLTYDGKLYPKQTFETNGHIVKVASHHVYQIAASQIKIVVYTDHGPIEKVFQVNELIKIKPKNESYKEAQPLSSDLFL